MGPVLDLFQSKNLTNSIKDLEDVPSLVVTSKYIDKYNEFGNDIPSIVGAFEGNITRCSISPQRVTQR